jgi:hypothetical protein
MADGIPVLVPNEGFVDIPQVVSSKLVAAMNCERRGAPKNDHDDRPHVRRHFSALIARRSAHQVHEEEGWLREERPPKMPDWRGWWVFINSASRG